MNFYSTFVHVILWLIVQIWHTRVRTQYVRFERSVETVYGALLPEGIGEHSP